MLDRLSWEKFTKARDRFRKFVTTLDKKLPFLKDIQQKFADSRGSSYTVETPVVYNTALNDITRDDDIKLILVADNPGRREQAAVNKRYLVGPSGKLANNFFRNNPELKIDFNKNVIILNKTPIHSPRTVELKELCKIDTSGLLASALEESQQTMASLLMDFYTSLDCPIWITGYSEMRKGGLFEIYTDEVNLLFADNKQIFIYRHFSMNQFTIDLKKRMLPGEPVKKALARIGTDYRKRILTY